MADLEDIKNKATTDLYFFAKQILGYKDMQYKPHKEVCDILTSSKKKQVLLMLPRGVFKSTIATISYPIWKIAQNRNLRIMIASETYSNAKKYLFEIKSHLESNEKLLTLFGRFKPKDANEGAWNEAEATVCGRRKIHREPSFSIAGIDQTKTGTHVDLIIMDDLVSNTNINSPEQLEKTINFYKYMLSILEPQHEGVVVVGTRWHFSDLYSYIIEHMKDTFEIHIKKAIEKDGSLLFPQRLSLEFLEQQKKIQGLKIFNAQYLNISSNEETALVNIKEIPFFKIEDVIHKNFEFFLTIDPAVSLKRSADFTALVVVGCDSEEKWYVFEAIRMKDKTSYIIDKIFELHAKYKFANIGLEALGLQLLFKEAIEKEMEARKVYLPLFPFKNETTRSKELRIQGLQPLFQRKQIYLQTSQIDLINELQEFPYTKHEDLSDALSRNIGFVFAAKDLTKKEIKEEIVHDEKMASYAKLPWKQRLMWENLELEQSGRRRKKVIETIEI